MGSELRNQYDVVVAGAGPAGSSLSIRLANSGLDVLLVEQKQFPREKLCGEFISPECLVHFEELGVLNAISDVGGTSLFETNFYTRRGRSVSVRSEWFGVSDSHALGLSRAEMDKILVEQARHAGVEVLEESVVTGLLMERSAVHGVTIKSRNGEMNEIFAKITVDATGRSRSLARRFDSKTTSRSAAKHVAFKTHLRGADIKPGSCEIYVYRGGYGGCNRVENDLYNLCFIASAVDTKRLESDPERIMRELVFSNDRARAAMEHATVAKPWLAVPIERFGRGDLVPAEGLITVGDSAAFIDPFTGSGILLALESGKIAAAEIAESFAKGRDFSDLARNYRSSYSSAFDSRLRVCSVVRHAAFIPLLAETVISVLSINERLRRRLAQATRFSAGSAS